MFIKYNGNNVHALGHISPKSKLNQSPEEVYFFRPGWNEFPKEIWDQYKTHPQIQMMLKRGSPDKEGKPTERPLIEVMSDTVTVKQGKKSIKKALGQDDKPLNLTDLDEKRAIEIAKSTFNRELLQRWLDEETRGKVVRILNKQIEPLLPNEEQDEEDDEDDAA